MVQVKVLLSAVLLLGFACVSALGQDVKLPDNKPAPVSWNEDREPKNEVEQMLAAAAKRGETVIGTCSENCPEGPESREPDGFERGRVIHLAKPAYSPLARAAGVKGTVKIQVIIDVDGKVIAAAAVDGHPLLYPACLQAARASEFSPTKWEGQPVKVIGVIQYNFVAM